MTIPIQIEDQLQRAAQAVTEQAEDEAVSRLMERLSAREDSQVLRDAMTLLGARALVREAQDGARHRGAADAVGVATVAQRIGQEKRA